MNIPIPMLRHTFRPLRLHPFPKPIIQIRACTKDPSMARHNDTSYTLVYVEHGVCGFQLRLHCVGECIVVLRAVKREDDDGCVLGMVLSADLGKREVVVGGRELDVWFVTGRLLGLSGHVG